jgi:colanic acid/amylovoran biosynthesis protein
MRIVISHVYSSHNNGDAAILSSQIDGLKTSFDDPEIYVFTIDKIEEGYTFEGVPVCNSLMYSSVSPENGRFRKLVLAIVMVVCTTIWAGFFRAFNVMMPLPPSLNRPLRLLVEADMQICVGGGYLRAKKDWSSTIILLLLFHQIWLASVLRKPVYLWAQSFGPYPTRVQRKIATVGLKFANLILVREGQSKALLAELGVADERVRQVPDSAFAFNPTILSCSQPELVDLPNGKVVGVTVRSWLPTEKQRAYELAMAAFLSIVSRQYGFKPVVIPQVTSVEKDDDDRIVGSRIRSLLADDCDVQFMNTRFSHHEIASIYANLDYLVGTRFHSVIFALSAGVPALAIEYEHKTSGIMKDLGLEEWTLPIEDVTCDKLLSLFELLVKNRESYTQELREVVPRYIKAAREGGSIIAAAYRQTANISDPIYA